MLSRIREMAQSIQRRRPSLLGDRDIEWSWVAGHIPQGPGRALDFGPGGSYLSLIAASRGFDVVALDLAERWRPYRHPRIRYEVGDVLRVPLAEGFYDLVLNCSTVEHVGIPGRYGVSESAQDGDIRAMERLRRALRPGGLMLLTIPVGEDAVYPPLHRVYGPARAPRLLQGFHVAQSQHWLKDEENRWRIVPEDQALHAPTKRRMYGLGCYALVKP